MTPSELKYHIETRGSESHFFDRKTMKFFGDTMSNFGVRAVTITSEFTASGDYVPEGVQREVWELYRKRAVKGGNKGSFYFDRDSFERVHKKVTYNQH